MGFLDNIVNKLGDFVDDFATGSSNKLQKEVEEFAAKPLEERQNIVKQTYEDVMDFLGTDSSSSVEEMTDTTASTNDVANVGSTQSAEPSPAPENGNSKNSSPAGAYLVCDGAMCSCDQGAVPMVKIPITTHKKYYANDKLAATVKDKNLPAPFFGKCNLKSPPGDVSCTYVPADWVIEKGEGHPVAGGIDILIDNGEIACPIGGKITIVNHGQQTAVSSKDVGGFSVDAAPAVCCLLPINTIVKLGSESNAGTTASVGHIICGEQKSNSKASIIKRASEQFVFEASASGNPNLVSWAIKKDGNNDWAVFARYGKKIPLTFNEGSKYTVVAFGRSPDTFKFSSAKADKSCYFNVEAIKENKLTHIEINGIKVAGGGKSFFIGEACSIVPKFRLSLNGAEQRAFILEVKNGENNVSEHLQRGDAPYTLPTDQETKYKVYAHYDGEINPEPIIAIEIVENSVSNITPDNKFARHGERRTFGVELRDKNNVNPDKIHWKVNGLEQRTGKNLTYIFDAGTADKNYKIEASYGGIFTESNVASRVVTTKLNTVNKILISDISSGQSGVVGGSYTIKADTIIPYFHLQDPLIKWKVILNPTDMKTAMGIGLKATFISLVSNEMKGFIHDFSATNTLQFTPLIEGTYTIYAELNGKKASLEFVVKQSEVKTWRFASSNGWTLRQLGMKHPFNIELAIEGWANKEITLSLFIQYASALGKTREVSLGKHTTNASGTITPIAINADHQLWKDVKDITTDTYGGYDIQKVNLVVSEKEYPYKTMHSVKGGLALYLPDGKGDMIQPVVTLCKSLSFEGRFADSENNTLRKILKYGEPAKAQIRILTGYSSNESAKEKYLFTLSENKSRGDDEIADFIKKEVELKSGEDIIDIPIDTEKLGKDTHVKDKKTEHNPRLFYFLLEEKGGFLADPDKLTYPSTMADTFNDETIIDLEAHDGKNDEEIDKRNEKKIKDTGKKDRHDYFNQLKVAADTTLNKSLENKAMAIIGEPLMPKRSGDCGGVHCITKDNYDKYPGVSKEKIGKLIQEINIRLAGFGGNVPTTEFTARTEATIKQFQRDYMKVPETGKICGGLLVAIDEFSKIDIYNNIAGYISCPCKGEDCKGFGAGLYSEQKNKSSILEMSRKYEYPGIHRSVMWAARAIAFYASKDSIYSYKEIYSGYRCHVRNRETGRTSTNHMGKAIDIHFYYHKDGKKETVEGKNDKSVSHMKAIKQKYIMDQMAPHPTFAPSNINKFALEPSGTGSSQAWSWIHLDVRGYELKYLGDSFFGKNKEEWDGELMITFVKNLGLANMASCKNFGGEASINQNDDRVDPKKLKTSSKGIEFIKSWESFKSKKYNCSAEHCTIGYGHKIHSGKCDERASEKEFENGISKEEGDKLFETDLIIFEKAVQRDIKVPLYQYEFDALVSLLFNAGPSFLNVGGTGKGETKIKKNINSKKYSEGADEFADVIRGGAGLKERRQDEINIFKNNIYKDHK